MKIRENGANSPHNFTLIPSIFWLGSDRSTPWQETAVLHHAIAKFRKTRRKDRMSMSRIPSPRDIQVKEGWNEFTCGLNFSRSIKSDSQACSFSVTLKRYMKSHFVDEAHTRSDMECSVCQDLQDLGLYFQVSHIIQGFGGQWYPGLVCRDCKKCVAISYEVDPPQWIWMDDILANPDMDTQGWQQAKSEWDCQRFQTHLNILKLRVFWDSILKEWFPGTWAWTLHWKRERQSPTWISLPIDLDDLWRHRILSGIVYQYNAPPKNEDFECQFGFPNLNVDQIFLLWISGQARGFCSLRTNGTSLGTPMDTYQLTVLDTIFIDPRVRGRGHASTMLKGLLADNHLGLSTPISNDMLITCLKALRKSPPSRERLWLVDNFGGAGERKNLWWSAVKLAKSRNLNLEIIFKWLTIIWC